MEFKISGETGRKERTDLRMAKPQYKGTDRVQGKSYQLENMLSPGERNPAQGVQQPSKAIYRFLQAIFVELSPPSEAPIP